MRTVREDKDMVLVRKIRDLFLSDDPNASNELTWEDFSEKLNFGTMQDYFKQINVSVSEAKALFELLDADGSGSVDSSEIVEGCLKLRGPARALELSILAKEVSEVHKTIYRL